MLRATFALSNIPNGGHDGGRRRLDGLMAWIGIGSKSQWGAVSDEGPPGCE